MTYEEFKEIIEMTGEYYVEVIEEHFVQTMIYVSDTEGNTMCKFWEGSTFGIDTIYMDNDEFLKQYLNVIIEFAKTPVKERYPIKKHYVKLDLPDFINGELFYLNQHILIDGGINYLLHTKTSIDNDSGDFKTKFTKAEIEEIIPSEHKYQFKFIPVEEEI